MQDKVLQVKNLKTYFCAARGIIRAVDGVSFDIGCGEAFGLVGESGSGKTLTALSILRLIPPSGRIMEGEILFNGANLLNMDEASLRAIRGSKISIVFQEPATALNPIFTVGCQVGEAILAHQRISKSEAREKVLQFFKMVHISDPDKIYHDYPHQLSGGLKQRVCIAMALVNSPQLIILDEPTTALDVTVQAQILDLLDEIRSRQNFTMLFISHDLGVIARICDDVAVMHKGRIVEMGDKKQILNTPKDPYTISLLESVKALS